MAKLTSRSPHSYSALLILHTPSFPSPTIPLEIAVSGPIKAKKP
ncbi:MAG: hypothetical protein ACJ72U_03665 [Nitrososphaeraceae archaeon]